MAAPFIDLVGDDALEQGSATTRPFLYTAPDEVTPIVLTGYTARMQVRRSVKATDVLLELTTANGGIVIDGAAGKVSMILTESVAQTLTWRRGVYDLELIPPSGQAFRFMQGEIEVTPEVTRAS